MVKELGAILYQMFSNAPMREQVVHIHLFGIKYGKKITSNRLSIKKFIAESGIKASYHTELSKLSKYVILKNL